LADHLVPSVAKSTVTLQTGKFTERLKLKHRANKLTHLARKKRKMDINEPLKQYVLGQLDQLWSPEQIAKRLKILYPRNMNM